MPSYSPEKKEESSKNIQSIRSGGKGKTSREVGILGCADYLNDGKRESSLKKIERLKVALPVINSEKKPTFEKHYRIEILLEASRTQIGQATAILDSKASLNLSHWSAFLKLVALEAIKCSSVAQTSIRSIVSAGQSCFTARQYKRSDDKPCMEPLIV